MPTFFFYVAVPPRITIRMKNAVPGNSFMLHAEAIGTPPLNYQWEWKPAQEGEWQLCDVERFPGADSSTIVISSVEKFKEGSYRCVVSNCAGTRSSYPSYPSKLSKNSVYI